MNKPLYYPKIPDSRDFPLGKCIAFEKLDGTNVHFDWNREHGWHAFGTRRDWFSWDQHGLELFEEIHPELNQLAFAFTQTLAEGLQAKFVTDSRCSSWTEVRCFGEYFGPSSFAGRHRADEEKRVVLFDVEADGRLLDPFEFVELFRELPIARVVYQGKFSGSFTEAVRAGRFNVGEGVICKCGQRGNVHMAKIKTNAYLARLQESFGDKWREYWE
ncbi:RNA ligase family protein [Blastopirellula marina]|uniref:RNA ligase domain-containing protein n=1 Tax=Blastopirellula marina TaxID=124 RepID=A0A2S8F9I7_9BACT|nr:RNA ligase family protein [Blastopirellula marina]PQO28817.1 hypothetical protein C5Y98_23925 [Blastopirellula marina]PTL42090.1 hypothetical protein C5Y97_23940 [Blastopirellula marina]